MPRKWPLLLGLFVGVAALLLAVSASSEPTEQWRLAARWTARAGFPLLILTFSASSLVRLLPNAATKALRRDRRWWGLGFAACHTVHLYALVTFFRVTGEPIPAPTLIGGGLGYLLLYAMVLTSNRASIKALGRNWKRLHKAGIYYLWFIFTFTFTGAVFEPERQIAGIAGALVALAALGARIAAWARSQRR